MNDIYVGSLFSDSHLEHHGILGMKWGVRRYQNKDGSLTDAGKKRKKAKAFVLQPFVSSNAKSHRRRAAEADEEAKNLNELGYKEQANRAAKRAEEHRKIATKIENDKAQRIGEKGLSDWEKLSKKYDTKIDKAIANGNYKKADALDQKYEKVFDKKIAKRFEKAGYDWVNRGTGYSSEEGWSRRLSYGKYESKGQEYVSFVIDSKHRKAYRRDDDY